MTQADLKTDRRTRWGAATLVIVLHVILVAGLIRAFTPDFAAQVVDTVTQAFTVEVSPPPSPAPSPPSPAPVSPAPPEPEGGAGEAGRKAVPREAAAPSAPIAVKPTQAPPVAGQGEQNASGARDEGAGPGAAGQGRGTGAGNAGQGQGGGGSGTATVKISGDINSARDYPRASRALRIGAAVTVDLTVGTDGRAGRLLV